MVTSREKRLDQLSSYAQFVLRKQGLDLTKTINEYINREESPVVVQGDYRPFNIAITAETPLGCMCRLSDFLVVKELLDAGASPTSADSAGNLPLSYIIQKIYARLSDNQFKILKLLLNLHDYDLLSRPLNGRGRKPLDCIVHVDAENTTFSEEVPLEQIRRNLGCFVPSMEDSPVNFILKKITERVYSKKDSQEAALVAQGIPQDVSNLITDYGIDIEEFLGDRVLKILADNKELLRDMEGYLSGWQILNRIERQAEEKMVNKIQLLENENKTLKENIAELRQRLEAISVSSTPIITNAFNNQKPVKREDRGVSDVKPKNKQS